VRASWLESREQSAAQAVALSPLTAVSWLWGAGARLHRASRSWRPPRRLGNRVVSVGNLVVGGSGKTPTAAWIAAGLHRRGHKVVLASRGYRGARREAVHVVSDGRYVYSRFEAAGDEPMLLAAHAPGVPVLVGRDRSLVGLRALSAFGADVLVLDDGFHHHRLHRDVDIVTFDAGLGFGNGWVLPRGPLREPPAALRHADAVVVVDGHLPEEDEARIARLAPDAERFAARRRPRALRPLRGGVAESPASLAGADVGLLAALARPGGFRRTLESLGARVVAERCFRDHHRYRPRDLRGLAAEAPRWITTEKDAVKLVPSWLRGVDVRVLSIEMEFDRPKVLLDWLETSLR
jgi:tetraacyldisaccharide 4'-kinase